MGDLKPEIQETNRKSRFVWKILVNCSIEFFIQLFLVGRGADVKIVQKEKIMEGKQKELTLGDCDKKK